MKNQILTPSKFEERKLTELCYCDDFDELTGNIIKANPEFIKYLTENESIVVEGDQDEQFLFNIDNSSYKLRGVFLPTTMLITNQFNYDFQNRYDEANDTPSRSHKPMAGVQLETGNYLKVEAHNIEFNAIYAELIQMGVDHEELMGAEGVVDLLERFGLPLSQIRQKFKITSTQFEQIAKYAEMAAFLPAELQFLTEPTYLCLNLSALLGIFRNLMPILTENGKMGLWFTYRQIESAIKIEHQRIWMVVVKMFDIEINYPPEENYKFVQKMQIEGENRVKKYRISLNSILHFVLMELASEKEQYTADQMDTILQKMLNLYLPVGIQQFQYGKARVQMAQILGLHFLTVLKGTITTRAYYNPLLIDSTIKGRIQFMSNYKKKFNIWEIKGVFSRFITRENTDINEILLKNFRKCGANDYEIKLIIPKK